MTTAAQFDLIGASYQLPPDGRPHSGHKVVVCETTPETGLVKVQCECGDERLASVELVERCVGA